MLALSEKLFFYPLSTQSHVTSAGLRIKSQDPDTLAPALR